MLSQEEFEKYMREIDGFLNSQPKKIIILEIVTQVFYSESIGMFEINVN